MQKISLTIALSDENTIANIEHHKVTEENTFKMCLASSPPMQGDSLIYLYTVFV